MTSLLQGVETYPHQKLRDIQSGNFTHAESIEMLSFLPSFLIYLHA